MIPMPPPRIWPALIVGALIITRVFIPDFLAAPVVDGWFVSWFWVILTPLLYIAAWLLTPVAVNVVTRMAGIGIILPIVFILVIVGTLWLLDLAWMQLVKSWCDGCPESQMLAAFTGVFGG